MFHRCYSLTSTARPIAANLFARFLRGDRLRQPKEIESIPKSNSSFEIGSGDCVVLNRQSTVSLDNRINTSTSTCVDYLNDHDIRDVKPLHPLEECTEDLSDIGPYLTPTFTFAKYADKSRTIQELVKLGVALHKWEDKEEGMVQFILNLDFDKNVKPYIRFLHDCGVPADYLGEFITRNPRIFKEDMDDLHTRIRYLRAHNFSKQMITTILCRNPKWLSYTVNDVDNRLGYFQANFKLNGKEIRHLAVKGPKVVLYKMVHLLQNTFSIKEEMGFDATQVKTLLLRVPRIWVKNRERLMRTFEYANDTMQLPHDLIVQQPNILFCRKSRLEQRHLFLVELKKAQYDPTKPMYISPLTLVTGTDVDFCRDVAKTSIEIYNAFLKTF